MRNYKNFKGGCLCGNVRYIAKGSPIFPHLCSCTVCRRWSGAPTPAWVEFALEDFEWISDDSALSFFQSSGKTKRGSCATCSSAICAIDDGYENISITIGSLDRPNLIIPDIQHSYRAFKPRWWHPEVAAPQKVKRK